MYAVIEKIEHSESAELLTQAITEIDGALDEIKAEIGRMAASSHQCRQKRLAIEEKHRNLELQIKTAMKKNSEEAASHAIKQQIDMESQISALDTQLAQNAAESQSMEAYLTALKAKKELLTTLLARKTSAELNMDSNRRQTQFQPDDVSKLKKKIAAVELTFDRIMAKPPEGNIERKSRTFRSAQLQELEEMALKTKIKERLAAAKRGIETND